VRADAAAAARLAAGVALPEDADWPRLVALCALTGAVLADLGVLPRALHDGAHLVFVPRARHVLVADVVPAGGGGRAPVVKVFPLAPIEAVAARQRAAFLRAAVSPIGAAAASETMLNASGFLDVTASAFGGGEGASATLQAAAAAGLDTDALLPRVLAVPPIALLDVGIARAPTGAAFRPGPPIAAISLAPRSSHVLIAQADGVLSLWDAAHRRHRLH
jgi:hypothetical protein